MKKAIYEGKAKILYSTDDPDRVIQFFKDDATAFDATKRGTIQSKGVCNNKISCRLFRFMEDQGIKTHFIEELSDREMLVKKLKIIPIEVTIRNRVAGGMAKMLGLEEGMELKQPVLEYHYKEDSLHDPLVNEDHIVAVGFASKKDLDEIREMTFKINGLLIDFLSERGMDLIDFKLEFGKHKGEILLGDELSPDVFRLWEKGTGRKMDKDRFRRDLGQVEEAYQEVLKRITG